MRRPFPALTGVVGLLPALAQAAQKRPADRFVEVASPVLMGLTVLLLGLGFTAAMLVTHLAAPGLTRRSALLARRTPGRSLLYGVMVTLTILLALLLAKSVSLGVGKLLGVVLLLPWLALALVGVAAACHSLGESLLVSSGSPHQDSGPWAVGAGAVLLALVNLLVGIGQLVWLTALLIGLGAVVRQLASRPAPLSASPPAPGA
jgi:hypothetical protein